VATRLLATTSGAFAITLLYVAGKVHTYSAHQVTETCMQQTQQEGDVAVRKCISDTQSHFGQHVVLPQPRVDNGAYMQLALLMAMAPLWTVHRLIVSERVHMVQKRCLIIN
jgi:hypothetical protein